MPFYYRVRVQTSCLGCGGRVRRKVKVFCYAGRTQAISISPRGGLAMKYRKHAAKEFARSVLREMISFEIVASEQNLRMAMIGRLKSGRILNCGSIRTLCTRTAPEAEQALPAASVAWMRPW
ncbi:MAG: hypothetical protein ACREUZ_22445 [Burkholderiales bacterium]